MLRVGKDDRSQGEPFGIMRLAILLLTLLCAASGCMSLQTGGAAAAPAPPTG